MTTRLNWPTTPPEELRTERFVLRPITADDAEADFDAVIDSRADLLGWEQTGWPADDFTVEENRADLESLEANHRAGRRYTYTVVEPADGRALGCVYVVPPSAKFLARAEIVSLGGGAWEHVEAAVCFWVRSSLASSGLEHTLVAELDRWLRTEWSLTTVVYVTTSDFERQVDLLTALDMRSAFAIHGPGNPVPYHGFLPADGHPPDVCVTTEHAYG